MRFIDYVRVAFGNILRQKLRSSLTIFAVVIGATSVTVMLALVSGAQGFVESQFKASGVLQQVLVTQATDLDYNSARWGGGNNDSTGVKVTDALASKIKAMPHVLRISPTTGVYVFDALLYNNQKLSVQQTTAYEPNGVIKQTVAAGRELSENDGAGTVTLTTQYADKLGFKGHYGDFVGKTITLQTQQFYTGPGANIAQPPSGPGGGNPPQQSPTLIQAKVAGIITSDDSAAIYFPLSWAKELLVNRHWESHNSGSNRGPNQQSQMTLVSSSDLDQRGYTNLTVQADSPDNVEALAKQIKKLGVGAVTANSELKKQLDTFKIVGLVLGGIGAIALFVAAIGVINTMVMAILERTREIGVMRACGATRKTIRRLFTFEAGLLGFWGGVLGLSIGYGLTLILNSVINKKLAESAIHSSNIISIPLWLMLGVLAITSVIGVLAGLYPASRAARLNPVEALRYE
jgi:ABC-type antimicrobial peptide transport system permease subunit